MTAQWLLANLAAYSIQFAVVFAAAAAAVRLFRPAPRVTLHIWESVFLLACLLPAWSWAMAFRVSQPLSAGWYALSSTSPADPAGTSIRIDWPIVMAVCVLSVTVARLGILAMGLARIHRWQREARLFETGQTTPDVEIRVSGAIDAPVTIGLLRPVVLVPEGFDGLADDVKRAVINHEGLHARRRDPLRILVVEVWRACLWFHPAAAALASRLDLARELTLDRDAIASSGDRRAYARALLAFTSTNSAVPAPAFNHRSHLAQRIEALTHQEVAMSASRRTVVLAVSVLVALAGSVGAAAVIPMSLGGAAVQAPVEPYRPGDGVSLPRVVHEVKAEYPPAALQAKIQGSVFMKAVVEVDGSTGRIAIVRSLDTEYGIDQAAMDALVQWRFEPGQKDGQAVPVQIEIEMRFNLK